MISVFYRDGDRLVSQLVRFAQFEADTQLWIFEGAFGGFFSVRAENLLRLKLR